MSGKMLVPAVTCATRIPGFGAISMDCHSGRRYDLSVETAPSVRSTCRGGTPAGLSRRVVRPGGESDRRGWLDFLSPISPPRGPSPDGARQGLSSRS